MRKTVLKVAAACAGLLLTAAAASAQTKITVAYTAVADFASGFYAVDALSLIHI